MRVKQTAVLIAVLFSSVLLFSCTRSSDATPDVVTTGPVVEEPSVENPPAQTVEHLDGNTETGDGSIVRVSDIDGDGFDEKIVLDPRQSGGVLSSSGYVLRVGGAVLIVEDPMSENYKPEFSIVDLDTADNFMEVAVSAKGPSEDPNTAFYHYDGKSLKSIGTLPGYYGVDIDGWEGKLHFAGDGSVWTEITSGFIETWSHEVLYKLTKDFTLEKAEGVLYPMEAEVVLRKDLRLLEEMGGTVYGITLKAGEKVVLTGSDDREWCLVENADGETGWFAVDGYGTSVQTVKETGLPVEEMFEGLFSAG